MCRALFANKTLPFLYIVYTTHNLYFVVLNDFFIIKNNKFSSLEKYVCLFFFHTNFLKPDTCSSMNRAPREVNPKGETQGPPPPPFLSVNNSSVFVLYAHKTPPRARNAPRALTHNYSNSYLRARKAAKKKRFGKKLE